MRMPFKAPHIGIRLAAPKGQYWTLVPLMLTGLSLTLFAATALLFGVWANGWLGALMLLALCVETFFLPYLLLPLALRLPQLLPWVRFDLKAELGINSKNPIPQRILLGALILLPGLPVLAAYDGHIAARAAASWIAPVDILARAGAGTALVFVILALVLAIPDLGAEASEE